MESKQQGQLRSAGIAIPIIALTGNALAEDQQSFLQAGANHVLVKPVAKHDLEATINTLMESRTRSHLKAHFS